MTRGSGQCVPRDAQRALRFAHVQIQARQVVQRVNQRDHLAGRFGQRSRARQVLQRGLYCMALKDATPALSQFMAARRGDPARRPATAADQKAPRAS